MLQTYPNCNVILLCVCVCVCVCVSTKINVYSPLIPINPSVCYQPQRDYQLCPNEEVSEDNREKPLILLTCANVRMQTLVV